MFYLGLNNGKTSFGKKLKDGGACVISENGEIIAISEERLTRVKGDSGFKNSLKYLLTARGISLNDISILVYSSCCEFNPHFNSISTDLIKCKKIINVPTHHFSHAINSFYLSGFDEAIVIVIDGGGDVLEKPKNPNEWWKYSREQVSYFTCNDSGLKLIGRDFNHPLDCGFGEVFRAFTKYLGWKTKYVGKLMSLSGLTDHTTFNTVELFNIDNKGVLNSKIICNPNNPIEMVNEFGQKYQLGLGNQRHPNDRIEDYHIDLAFYVQNQYQLSITAKIQYLIKKYRIKNICISGGVGLNCTANSYIANNSDLNQIYIPPATGDQGQCLGNALYGFSLDFKKRNLFNTNSSFFGIDYKINDQVLSKHIMEINPNMKCTYIDNPPKIIAELLSENEIVAHFNGKSEFGPRALGNRSIFANPSFNKNKNLLNEIKGRESFNPFAVSILESYLNEYFIPGKLKSSPFMLFSFKVNSIKKSLITAALHVDDTCRVQTVTENSSLVLYSIISEFNKLTHLPLIINTSFNSKDEPIVENVFDAINCFNKLNINYLMMENYLITKLIIDN